jgi:hypothetical protein
LDENADGIRQSPEKGIEGVRVQLFSSLTSVDPIAQALTNVDGIYTFSFIRNNIRKIDYDY